MGLLVSLSMLRSVCDFIVGNDLEAVVLCLGTLCLFTFVLAFFRAVDEHRLSLARRRRLRQEKIEATTELLVALDRLLAARDRRSWREFQRVLLTVWLRARRAWFNHHPYYGIARTVFAALVGSISALAAYGGWDFLRDLVDRFFDLFVRPADSTGAAGVTP